MLLSTKNLRKLRRLRRRLGLAGLVLIAGGACWSGGMALAHTRPAVDALPKNVPERVVCGEFPWPGRALGGEDLLNRPEIHGQEEACNAEGGYPSGQEFEVSGPGWRYSSLDGLEVQPKDQNSPDPRSLGWDGKVPAWGLFSAREANRSMPFGLALGAGVRAVEARVWAQDRKGQCVIHLNQEPKVSEATPLPEVWRQLPSASVMGCLRREVAEMVFESQPGLARRLVSPAEHWFAGSVEAPELARSSWLDFQAGWLPQAVWGDYEVAGVSASRDVQVRSDKQGTLWTVGMADAGGTSIVPEHSPDCVGLGRVHGAGKRFEWRARLEGRQLIVDVNWSDLPVTQESEVASMGPDLETLYTPRPNVIAGR